MRSEDLDPSSAASGLSRPGPGRGRTVSAIACAVAIAATGAGGLVFTATPASASTVTETFAGSGPTGPFELQTTETVNQPASVSPGQTMTISVASSSQPVPTTQSGVAVNYISGLQTLIPVPANSTYVGNIVAGNWSFKPAGGGAATTGPLTVTECTGTVAGKCTATTPDGKKFLGPGTSTPYLEATTGTAQFASGGTLTLPGWSFDVKAGNSGTIQTTVSEFDTSANVTVFNTKITAPVAAYPAAAVSGCLTAGGTCTTQPAYQFQAIATTTIGSSSGNTTTTTTTASSGGTTTTTTTAAGSSGDTTTTTAAGATVASGGSTPTTVAAAGSLAYTGPPKQVWLLGLLGLVLLDIGYLAVSATWKRRRAGNSSAG